MVTLANVGRDASVALTYGTSATVDAFFLAMMIPVFVLTVGTSAYRSTIVPLLERVIHSNGKRCIAKLTPYLLTLNLLMVGGAGVFLALLAPFYTPLLGGGQHADTATLLTTLSWAVLPMSLLSAYASLAEGPLQTLGHYFGPTLFRAALPLGIAAGAISLGPTLGIIGACYGGIVGAIVHVAATAWLLPRSQPMDPSLSAQTPTMTREIRQQFGLLSAGVAIGYASPVIDQWMASYLEAGSVSTLSYANRLIVGAASLATSALSPALLPHFSRLTASGERYVLNTHYVAIMRITWWGGLALAGVMWVLADPFVAFFYEHGNFTRQDSLAVANIMGWLCLQFPPMLTGVVGAALLSAAGMNRVFLPLSVLIAIVNVLGNFSLMPYLGLAGIALSTVITYCVSFITINLMLIRRSIIQPQLVFIKDLAISVGTAVLLVTILSMGDAKLSPVPTGRQLVLCALAMGVYCGVACLLTRQLFFTVRSRA